MCDFIISTLNFRGVGLNWKGHLRPQVQSEWQKGILFARKFLPISYTADEVIPGVLLKFKAVFKNVKLVFLSVYAPTNPVEKITFLNIVSECVANCVNGFRFLGLNFNCTENPDLILNHIQLQSARSNC